jgi:ATP-binding cassette subfamily B protein
MFNKEKPQVNRPVEWRRIGALFLPYWKKEVQVFAAIVMTSLLGLLPPLFTLWLIDKAIPSKDFTLVCLYVGGMVLSALTAGLIGVYQGYLNALVGEGIMRDIRTSLVSHLHRMPLSFFANTKTGEIMNRVSNDVENVDGVVTGTLVTVVTNVIIIITTLVTIFILDWRLALLSVAIVPVMIIPLWPVGRKMYDVRKSTRQKRDEIESITQETLSISGITLVKSFVREKFERQRFNTVGTELMDLEVRLAMVGRWFMMVITAMVTIGPALVWMGGGWLSIYQGVTIGTVVTFVALLGRLYTPASTLAGVQVQVVSALAVFERIFEYLDMQEEPGHDSSAPLLENVAGKVTFEDVTFAYREDRIALKNISFTAEPGEMVAFVGPSGAGKTTIGQLVLRFYDPQSGRVLVDDHDIREVQLDSLREHIGIVTQETYLFHDTIANNMRYAKPEASQEELEQAARAANIHRFIETLPEGYETVVGERGHKLSGGERQRLAIARVLLKNPRILVLDEATSSLDSYNESLIQAALVPLMSGRTSLVIAHRLSTILSADKICVVESGRIVETGPHAVLLAQNGAYARLYREQFRDSNGKESQSAACNVDAAIHQAEHDQVLQAGKLGDASI